MRRRIHKEALLAILAALAIALAAPTSASAKKTHLFAETFGPAAKPSFGNSNGIAVDRSSGDLLVIDSNADTVSRWNPDGTPHDFSTLGTNVIDAKGTGQCATVPADCDQTPQNGFTFDGFAGTQQVAVDNSGTATDGDIYVTQGPQAAGNLIDIFAASGEYLGQLTAAGATKFGTSGPTFSPCGVAVDGAGNLFAAGGFEKKIYKFDPSANPPLNTDYVAPSFSTPEEVCNLAAGAGPSAGALFANTYFTFKSNSVLKFDGSSGALQYVVDPGENRLVAVDDPISGHLFAAGADTTIREFNAAGGSGATSVSSFPSGASGIAADASRDRVYVSKGEGKISVYGPLVTIPDVTTGEYEITGDTSVRVKGTVNPDGQALTDCVFEYGTTPDSGQAAPCAETPAEIGAGFSPVEVHADLGPLGAETLYHYRLLAKNANAALYPNDPRATVKGSDRTFKTPGKPRIAALWAADVAVNEATLKATINPENSATTYRFEWGPDASYGESTGEIGIGSDNTDRTVSLLLSELQPGATYHYRAVATNGIGIAEAPDHAFTAFAIPPPLPPDTCPNAGFRSGPAALLPDCRAYEMASPIEKGNADILAPNVGAGQGEIAAIDQGAASGQRLTYSSYRAFGDAVSSPYSSQYLASRDAEAQEWVSHGISPPRSFNILSAGINLFDMEFRAFSEDLCTGWLLHSGGPTLTEDAVTGFPNLYRRRNCAPDADTYEAITTVPPPNLEPHSFLPALQGLSADGSRAVFRVNEQLTPDANPIEPGLSNPGEEGTNYQCYESLEGELRLISVLPSGTADEQHCSVGTAIQANSKFRHESLERAVSEDASRIFWTSSAEPRGPGRLYLRLNPAAEQSAVVSEECTEAAKACTVHVSKEAEELSGTSSSRFWTAAADGSKAIFTVGSLTPGVSSLDLYQFELDEDNPKESKSTLIAGQVAGLLGASEDASRIYLVSAEDLDEGASAGEPNLYLYEAGKGAEAGTFRFVAVLSADDARAGVGPSGLNPSPVSFPPLSRSARVTPDGSAVAFTSSASLTGYDNADAASGEADAEVFHYDSRASGGAGELVCVSCNPSGARPAGRNVGGAVLERFWAAALLPPSQTPFHFTRALSSDGQRLFFESTDALVLRDTNGAQDVYQWEAAGKGSCSGAHRDFSAAAGGCVSLISSGQSPQSSEFVDASADGSDVFFKTGASLLPQDPGLIDIYDARVEGGFPQPTTTAGCEGEACQSPPAPPDDPTPASSAGEYAGNVVAEAPAAGHCRKPKVRRHGRCVPKHHKRAKRVHHRAAGHNRRAGRR